MLLEEHVELVLVEHDERAVSVGPQVECQVDIGQLARLSIELSRESEIAVPALQGAVGCADLKDVVKASRRVVRAGDGSHSRTPGVTTSGSRVKVVELDEHIAAPKGGP